MVASSSVVPASTDAPAKSAQVALTPEKILMLLAAVADGTPAAETSAAPAATKSPIEQLEKAKAEAAAKAKEEAAKAVETTAGI